MNLTHRQPTPKIRRTFPGIRESARGEDCTLRLPCCTFDPSRTVLAHVRQFSGAGMGHKPPDWWAVYACDRCHAEQERLSASDLCGYDDILRALHLTMQRLTDKGLATWGKQ